MKKVLIALGALLLVGVLLLAGLGRTGFSLFGVGWSWSPEAAAVEALARSFLEDIQFKDFQKAASYHTWTDEQKADIPKLIEDLFQVKPEQLNISDIRITRVELDRDGKRARTFFTTQLEVLNSKHQSQAEEPKNERREVEGVLFWHKRPAAEDVPPPTEAPSPPADATAAAPAAPTPAAPPSPPPTPGTAAAEGERWFLRLESSLRR